MRGKEGKKRCEDEKDGQKPQQKAEKSQESKPQSQNQQKAEQKPQNNQQKQNQQKPQNPQNNQPKAEKAPVKQEVKVDFYGRSIPKHAHGTTHLARRVNSIRLITQALIGLYDRIVDKKLLIRRINMTACDLITETEALKKQEFSQINLFSDFTSLKETMEEEEIELKKEKNLQKTLIEIKKKYGKNSVLKLMNLEEDATGRDRNAQIGGHKA